MVRRFWWVPLLVVIVWLVGGLAVKLLNGGDLTASGQSGDMFGAINSLFTGLAFAGLVVTLVAQQEQLELQREELKLQREELRQQREEMVASRAELANQVATQKAMVRATLAQIVVAKVQGKIEAAKVRAGNGIGNQAAEAAKEIEELADALGALSDRLERQCDEMTSRREDV